MTGGWEEIDDCFDTPFACTSILDDPRKIYEYLRSKVYKQDEACKAAAMILYNHVKGITSRNIFCGPAGSGKTYIWNIIKNKLYPYVIIADASTITKTGWSGSNKISSALYQINPCVRSGYIIVYDEFDKLCKPQYSRDENVSACVQSELLTLIQPSNECMRLKSSDGSERTIRVDNISYVFCGSFHEASLNESTKECSSGLGFGAVKKEVKAFDKELSIQTLVEYGVAMEVMSRITRLVNLRPLTEEAYAYLVNNHNNSPVKRIEDMYGLHRGFITEKVLNKDELNQIATDAFKSGLGVRSVTASIQRKVDDYIFEHLDVRWNDRITYDGTWENNLFNFFSKVTPKLTEDLPKPFKLEGGLQRIDETPVHKAVREAFVNLIIHADYLMDAGTLKIIKKNKSFEFTNPGILKLPIEDIFRGGNSKPRNPHMQTMLRMVGFGDNAGSGFPTILATWEAEGWIEPKLVENTSLNQVTLELCMMPAWLLKLQELEAQIIEKLNASPEKLQAIQKSLGEAIGNISIPKTEGMEAAIVAFAKSISVMPTVQYESIGNALMEVAKQGKEIADSAKLLSDKLAEKSAEKVSESAEKSAEKITAKLSKRQKQILEYMKKGVLYSTEELAVAIGLKGPRTRQLLNELVAMGVVECTAATKNRRYIRK